MYPRPIVALSILAAICLALSGVAFSAQQLLTPPASGARILLLPRRIVSGERATLAVLDINGRLTPGVSITFSNGDHLSTDATGRALFVAPLDPGVISATIEGRSGKVYTTILTPTEAGSLSLTVTSAPRVASLTDRFEIAGQGFCGDADSNLVSIAGQSALVLASSPSSLVVLPPADLSTGPSPVEISCAKRAATPFVVTFVGLTLEADSSPLTPGQHRVLTVRVRGTSSKIVLEARNLAEDITELQGGNPVKASSSGGADNTAQFELIGRQRGNFLVSIRLVSPQSAPHR